MRRIWVYRDGKMVPKEEASTRGVISAPLVMGDMPDCLSPIDNTVINGRRGYREHCKRYGVTNISDYTETWKKKRAERERFFTHGPDRGIREALIRAFDSKRR